MRKIKYQGGLTKLVTSKIGAENKKRFSKFIHTNANLNDLRLQVDTNISVPMEVVSFSSTHDFSEQVLSILSYVKYVGNPDSWIVYSDGSHKPEEIKLLESSFPYVRVILTDWNKPPENFKESLLPYKEQFLHYASKAAFGKRLINYLNHSIQKPTLFLDSDILFYNLGSGLKNLLNENVSGWYLPDAEWGCLDSHYKANQVPQAYQVNAGFVLICKELDNVRNGLEFLKSLNFTYEYFSEQTVMHIIMRDNGFIPFDPRIFILDAGDQFDFSYLYPKSKMAIRHYTGPVRHKMWQKDWKWQLGI